MGGILSTLRQVWQGIQYLRDISADFNAALARAAQSPGLPVPLLLQPSAPYWLDDPPYPDLVDARSDKLPDTANVVIIGSGITGAAVAYSLFHERARVDDAEDGGERIKGNEEEPSRNVVVLEARDLCSGATGRNGGHIKPPTYENFMRLRKNMSMERIAAITRFQIQHIDRLTQLCAAEGIEIAKARHVDTLDLFLDDKTFREAVDAVEEMRKWIPEFEVSVHEGPAVKEFQVNESVVGVIKYRAGAIWPYRFVVSIWKRLLDDFTDDISIETNTPAECVEILDPESDHLSREFPYAVHTPRGIIRARHVVHATNAFASHLVPGLRSKITGALATMSAQQPGDRFPVYKGDVSWSIIYGSGFDYVTQQPPHPTGAPGDLMIGGGLFRSAKEGIDAIGIYDDAAAPEPMTVAHIVGVFPAIYYPKWGNGAGVGKVWTGIIGISGDMCPFVGRLDDASFTGRKPKRDSKDDGKSEVRPGAGEWIAAGFTGEGMAWAWLSGAALGIMIAGSEDKNLPDVPGRPGGKLRDWFPSELLPSKDRLRTADISNLADTLS